MAIATPSIGEPSAHYAMDSNVQPFVAPDFDPAVYLNAALPPLAVSSAARSTQSRSVPLSELSTQLQNLLSQLNAQTTRMSNTLTQLTDEIVRSGGRLAYEVEMLKGETTGLTDALDNGLKSDIELFTPPAPVGEVESSSGQTSSEPEYLQRLRTLTLVRTKLDSVIKVFGDAMAWPIAHSEASTSLITISAPENDAATRDAEEKVKLYAWNLRGEINDMIGSGNDVPGLEAAATRLEELQLLAEVWKGTAEEKARLKFVESMQKPVDERLKALSARSEGAKAGNVPSAGVDYRYGGGGGTGPDPSKTTIDTGSGFLQNLRNLKNEMYLD